MAVAKALLNGAGMKAGTIRAPSTIAAVRQTRVR